jgi:transposase
MDSNLFWFSDEQWAKIAPHLLTKSTGTRALKDNRRTLSGIMHVLKVGCRWQDCPKDPIAVRPGGRTSHGSRSEGL